METLLSILTAMTPYGFRAPLTRLIYKRQTYADWTADEMPDLSGRVALVTGGTGGLGLETAFSLASHGATVFLGARSDVKAAAALKTIASRLAASPHPSIKPGKVIYLPCDMRSIRTARRAARNLLRILDEMRAEWQDGRARLDILVLAAGIASGPWKLNEDGIESFMATNTVSHLALLDLLLPLLHSTSLGLAPWQASNRIVFVSSSTHHLCSAPWPFALRPTFQGWDDVNDPRRWEGGRYAQSKLAQISLASHLSSLLETLTAPSSAEGRRAPRLTALSLHPGEVTTPLVEGLVPPLLWYLLSSLISLCLLNVLQGARTILFAASSPVIDDEGWGGAYLTHPCTLATKSRLARDGELQERTWRLFMRRVAEVTQTIEEEEQAEEIVVGGERVNQRGKDDELRLLRIYQRQLEVRA